MSFLRNIATAIVRSAGYTIPTDIQKSTSSSAQSGFSSILGKLQNGTTANAIAMPTPPTPPADPTDTEAQQKYNTALLKYNQQFQGYQSQMMGMFFQRFQLMQQAIWQAQRSQQAASQSSTLSPSYNSGVGGILGGDSSV